MRALLIANPTATATTARGRDVLAHALASEIRLEVAETKARGHATELAEQAVREDFDVVVALGGDGTVNEVVNGLLSNGPQERLPALAVVPGGNANVFARALGLAPTAVEATSEVIDALCAGRRRSIGLGLVEQRWFTFCAGFGFDAQVVRGVEARRAAGKRATPQLFVRTALRQWFTDAQRRESPITLVRPGAEDVRLGLALVCNSDPWTYLGDRPVRPCPEASFESGLDVFGLRRLGTVSTLRHLRQILATEPRPRGRRVVVVHDLPEVELHADRPLPLQVDGDDLGDHAVVRLRSVPDALDVVV